MVSQESSSDTDSRSMRLKVKFPKLGKKKLEEEDKPKSGQGVQGFIGKCPPSTGIGVMKTSPAARVPPRDLELP